MRLLVFIYLTTYLLNHSALAGEKVQLDIEAAKTFALRNNHKIQALRSKLEAREHGISILCHRLRICFESTARRIEEGFRESFQSQNGIGDGCSRSST